MKTWIVLCMTVLFPHLASAADIQATLQWSQRVELSPSVSGIVQIVNVEVGDMVKKNQVLLSLDSTAYQAKVAASQSEITRLNAEAEEATRELARVQELHDRSVTSTTELDQAKLQQVKNQSLLSEARARLQQNQKTLDDTSLRAPFDAVVVIRQAEPGLTVAAGLQPQMLLTLARSGEMIARIHLTPAQMNNLKISQTIIVSVGGINHSGKIKTLGMEPSKTKEGTVYPVEVLFPSKQILRAGTPAVVKLP